MVILNAVGSKLGSRRPRPEGDTTASGWLWVRGGALALAVLLSGCATAGGSGNNPFAAPGSNSAASVEIQAQNQEDQDVTVYTVIQGKRHEIGVVSAYTTATLMINAPRNRAMRIRVQPQEGLYDETGDVLVGPGDTVALYITPNPANTYVQVQ